MITILSDITGIIGMGCKVVIMLIALVLLIYMLKNLVKGLWEADKIAEQEDRDEQENTGK